MTRTRRAWPTSYSSEPMNKPMTSSAITGSPMMYRTASDSLTSSSDENDFR